jgi:hypothetical protein
MQALGSGTNYEKKLKLKFKCHFHETFKQGNEAAMISYMLLKHAQGPYPSSQSHMLLPQTGCFHLLHDVTRAARMLRNILPRAGAIR